ncbi:hypothetical protein YC2023_097992 [Brassica napus]
MVVRGRSLMMVSTNDYDEPSANGRHNPPGGRHGGGRRGRLPRAVDDLPGSRLVNAELEEGIKCFLKCCINMKLPTFLCIKMRRRPLEFIIAYGRSKDKRKSIESRHANHKTDHKQNYYRSFIYKDKHGLHLIWKKTSSEDFIRRLPGSPVWKTSWKSSSALYFRRLTCKSSKKSSRSEKICISNPDLKNLHIKKRSNDLKTEKMNFVRRLPRSPKSSGRLPGSRLEDSSGRLPGSRLEDSSGRLPGSCLAHYILDD